MAEQKKAARAAWKGSGSKASDEIWFDIAEEQGATEFTGYLGHDGEGVVVALVKDGARVETAGEGDKVVILTNQTPFYGESGGQIGDTGKISSDKGLEADVEDTSKPLGKLHAHHAVIRKGAVAVGDAVHLSVDAERRGEGARQSQRHPSAPRRAAPAARQSCHPEGQPGRAGPFPVRFLASQADDPRGDRDGRGRRQSPHPRECAGRHPPDDPRRGDRGRRDGPVRREIWRRGAGALDGPRRGRELFGRAVRRHPRQRARRHPAVQDHLAKAPSPPACAGSRR